MSDQSKLGIGSIIASEQFKDAIHVAVAPLQCADDCCKAGDHVGISNGYFSKEATPLIGIVDPFLKTNVKRMQRVWIFLYPGSITSLRHQWTHPLFSTDGTAVTSESERWLRDFADSVGADYDQMIHVATTHCEGERGYGDYLIEGGRWEGQGTPDEFWAHFTNVTGRKPKTEYGLPGIFSCSC